ncbi:hypothetical protein L3X38_010840 [Prunus dulcis]|uniref:Integrase catalytic domain-containing protein n=1 Tax=Prunus dulcis TaxID=3755 RepID=A0AAD4WHW6_PRUDU|nr:hypothetical protein L3X38_010840 [Prunus dulcis]
MNRADPASKQLALRQPRLLPCRKKTHFRGARHLPKLSAAKPNLQDTCRHHNGLHKVPHWNFVQSSHFHLPINREQYPGKNKDYSPTFTVTLPELLPVTDLGIGEPSAGTTPVSEEEGHYVLHRLLHQSIVCRFGIPNSIVTDNGRQFDNAKFKQFCSNLKIRLCFASPAHPQSNSQVEAVNKIIKKTLKTKLDKATGCWPELLPEVLWSYRTTFRTSTGETPFSLSFGTEAVAPVEIGQPTYRTSTYDATANDEQLALNLDFIDKLRDNRACAMSRTNNASPNTTTPKSSPVLSKWGTGSCARYPWLPKIPTKLRDSTGKTLPHPWNADHLKYYYK